MEDPNPVEATNNSDLTLPSPVSCPSTEHSTWNTASSHKITFKDKQADYGKPIKGSQTEARAKRACEHINKEVQVLISVIRGIGKAREDNPDVVDVKFGKLFQYYTTISNKVVGILLRARRWKLVDFPGEILYQSRDDNVTVTLLVGQDVVPTLRHFRDTIGDSPPPPETLKQKLHRINSQTEIKPS